MAKHKSGSGKKRATTAARSKRADVDRPARELSVPAAPSGASGRRASRKPWTARVDVQGGLAAAAHTARAANLSSEGIFVETTLTLEVGDPVLLTFRDPAGQALRLSGRVRWTTPFGSLRDPRAGMGIELTGLDAARRRRVQALVERLPAERDTSGRASAAC